MGTEIRGAWHGLREAVGRSLFDTVSWSVAIAGLFAAAVLTNSVGVTVVVAVVVALARWALSVWRTERTHRMQAAAEADEARDIFERELAEMRRIAYLARSLLLEVELWTDVDALETYADAQRAHPGRELPRPPSWTAAAIIVRGREALEPVRVRGWSTIAQALRSNAAHLTNLIDQEFPGPPPERRADLRSVFRASEKAAEGAEWLAAARHRVIELASGAPTEDRRRAEDALKEAGYFFFGALQWIDGTIEQLERAEQMRRQIEESPAD